MSDQPTVRGVATDVTTDVTSGPGVPPVGDATASITAAMPVTPDPLTGPARTGADEPVRDVDRRPRVRRVTRVVRSIDTWTVFKVALVFHLVLYVTMLVAGVLIWNVANSTGTVDNVERFMESFGWETFQFDGGQLFDAAWRIGLFLVIGLTGIAVLAATTFNLITDLVGGVRVTVLEEEVIATARGGRAGRSARRGSRDAGDPAVGQSRSTR